MPSFLAANFIGSLPGQCCIFLISFSPSCALLLCVSCYMLGMPD